MPDYYINRDAARRAAERIAFDFGLSIAESSEFAAKIIGLWRATMPADDWEDLVRHALKSGGEPCV